MSKQIRQQIENYQRDLQILQRKYDTSKGKLDLIKSNLEKEFGISSEEEAEILLEKKEKELSIKNKLLQKMIEDFRQKYLCRA